MLSRELKIFSGTANIPLAERICTMLEQPLGAAWMGQFKNGETRIRIEEHVRGRDVFVIQPTRPPDHAIIELLLMIDALKRASAGRITAVIPYFGYAKQEKKTIGREPISAKLSRTSSPPPAPTGSWRSTSTPPQSRAFSIFPSTTSPRCRFSPTTCSRSNYGSVVVVSPDTGGVARANDFRDRAGARSRHYL